MSTAEMSVATKVRTPSASKLAFKLEVVAIPVSDVERAKRFYEHLGWRLDGDFVKGGEFRGLQFTPPGSSTSIHFGKGVTSATPGTAQGLYLVVSDIVAARADLQARGIEVSEVVHVAAPGEPPVSGLHPERRSYSSVAFFKDPDGNQWLLQEVNARLPGRVDEEETTFVSAAELANTLRRAALAHGEHEKRLPGQKHEDWPEWYAQYIFAEQTGKAVPV